MTNHRSLAYRGNKPDVRTDRAMHPIERLPSFPFGDDDSPDQRRTITLPLVDIGAQLARGSRYPDSQKLVVPIRWDAERRQIVRISSRRIAHLSESEEVSPYIAPRRFHRGFIASLQSIRPLYLHTTEDSMTDHQSPGTILLGFATSTFPPGCHMMQLCQSTAICLARCQTSGGAFSRK